MKLVLHIGTQKTATSSIQLFLHENRTNLKADGYIYPNISRFDNVQFKGVSYHNCVASALSQTDSTFPKLSPQGVDKLRKFIISADLPVLLSGEDFSRSLDLEGVAEFLEGIDTQVIVYLREQPAWAQSLYNQRNKLLFSRGDSRLFGEGVLTADDLFLFLRQERYAPLLHYDKMLERWAAVVGRDRVTVRVFSPKEMHQGDIIRDFMMTLGIEDLAAYKEPTRVNDNLANAWIVLVREFAEKHGVEMAKAVAIELDRKARAGAISLSGDTSLLNNRIKNRMRLDYAASNQRVARQYLDRDELFPQA